MSAGIRGVLCGLCAAGLAVEASDWRGANDEAHNNESVYKGEVSEL
jgi:hypothetical protein